jgi:hypothetical protein
MAKSNINDPSKNLEIDSEVNSRLHASGQAPVPMDPTEREFHNAEGAGGTEHRRQAIARARKANKQAPLKFGDSSY